MSKKSKKANDLPTNDQEHSGNTTQVFHIIHDEEVKPLNLEKPKKKKGGILHVITVILAILVVLVILAGASVGGAGLWYAKGVVDTAPDLQITDFVSNESTKMYDKNGEIITELGAYLRENISYDQCPESLVDAFVSIEDSRFFEHFGFDIPRFSKAIIENIAARSFAQGGSTFTMQLVKNTYFQVDALDNGTMAAKSIDRKIQEIYLAINLETQIDKKKIFELYMNKLNFGNNIRGVQKAALYYFGKDITDINLSESALLAGIINMPNGYNPYYHLDAATKRRNEVIEMMRYHGYITEEESALAKSIKVEDQLVGENFIEVKSESTAYQSYIDAVIQEAQRLTGKDPSLAGMKIYTYMDRTIQGTVDSIQNGTANIKFPDDLMQVAMCIMNNNNGSVVAVGGGRNYNASRLLNRATSQYKQPGSSVKPLLSYALAFEHLGWSLDHVVEDRPITYPGESRVLVNFDDKYRGDVPLKDAVGTSLNIPAILTLEAVTEEIGPRAVVNYMKDLGYTRVSEDNYHYSYAIGGGTFETTPFEMAGAYSAMMNGGVYNEPHTIEKIVMQDGTVYYPVNQNRKVLSSGAAWLVTRLLYNNVYGPYFNYMQVLKSEYPVFAKTGTTDWGTDGVQYGIPKGAAKDKWMISNTTQYTNAIWVGYDKAVSGENCYFSAAKSSLNIPGNLNRIILDSEEEVVGIEALKEDIPKPSDVEDITYVYGSYPYAKFEAGMPEHLRITSQVASAGKKELQSIYDHERDAAFNGISATVRDDGALIVTWSVGQGGCYGNTKNISLIDNYNHIEATGACLFDYSWITGERGTFYATVYCDDNWAGEIYSDNGYYESWDIGLWGTVKVCGTANGGETKCSVAQYAPTEW
ncbi:MAG: transglycosylase domain-containing protein [Erysipelotrichaceae bacterium]|nr:transglycosylase domain-containing protein [Erysipelotrichaceae bacterium]